MIVNHLILCVPPTRPETRAALWAAESRPACNSGERARPSVRRGAGRSRSRSESLRLWGLQRRRRGRSTEAVQRGRRSGPRGHARGGAAREGGGPRTQHPGDGGGGGSGLPRPAAGAAPLQPEVQTRLAAEGRRRGRRVAAQEAGGRSATGQRYRGDFGGGLSHSACSSQKTIVILYSLAPFRLSLSTRCRLHIWLFKVSELEMT